MKIIIIEGPDNTGKNTLIQNIIDTNRIVKLVHCDKPLSTYDPLRQQTQVFNYHASEAINEYLNSKYTEVVVFNRYYPGEYVYGQMYRDEDPEQIKMMVSSIESYLLANIDYDDILYVQLLSTSPKLLVKNDDGKSMSDGNYEKIEKEIKLFKEVYDFSKLKKHIIYVNDGDNFRSREDILIEFKDFINNGI